MKISKATRPFRTNGRIRLDFTFENQRKGFQGIAPVALKLPDEVIQRWEKVVRALMALRGFQEVIAMTLVAEAGDFSRFDDPRQLMAYFGLVPSEHTSADKRYQGSITKCGNGACRRALTEAAWAYIHQPAVSPPLRQRQQNQPRAVIDISWKAQQPLHKRFNQLSRHRKKSVVAVTAVARELAGFVWAVACQISAPEKLKTHRPQPASNGARIFVLDRTRKFEKTSKSS